MKFTSFNNATLICESSKGNLLTLDPWLIGCLYWDTWSPCVKITKDELNLFLKTKVVYISHLHIDHWDLETIKLLDNETLFILPDLPFIKRVIGEKLIKFGYQNITYIRRSEKLPVSDDISITFIPTLNFYGAEVDLYENNSSEFEHAIDTGLIINDTINEVSHIALCDNTPYLPDSGGIIKDLIPEGYVIGSIWYPYNGAAQDFPLCYDNYSFKEKQHLIKERNNKRNQFIFKLKEYLEPKVLLPYSSDFMLKGKRSKEFFKVNSKSLTREFSVDELNKLSKDKNFIALNYGESIEFNNNGIDLNVIRNITNNISKDYEDRPNEKFFTNKYSSEELNTILNESLKSLLKRINLYNLKEIKIPLVVCLLDLKIYFVVDFRLSRIHKNKIKGNFDIEIIKSLYEEYVCINTISNIFGDMLMRKAHYDNLQISCLLDWNRKVKNNRYPKELYDALNFFHL